MFPYSKTIPALLFITLLISCKNEKHDPPTISVTEEKIEVPDHIVVISKNAPEAQRIYVSKDKNGNVDSTGGWMTTSAWAFQYLDDNNLIQSWRPQPLNNDTIQIKIKRDKLELSMFDPFAAQPTTFLVSRGDSVEIIFEEFFAKAKILNREYKDLDLNYHKFRKERFFVNGLSPHHFINQMPSPTDSLDFKEAAHRAQQESYDLLLEEERIIDSLYESESLSSSVRSYRKSILQKQKRGLEYAIKANSDINRFGDVKQELLNSEGIYENLSHDKIDSLMRYNHHRSEIMLDIQRGFPMIKLDRGTSGGFFRDSRKMFDSIVTRDYSQSVKEMMLFNTYRGIVENFKVKDKKEYYQKLAENTANIEKLNKIKKSYNLDFGSENKLLLMNQLGVESEYSQLREKHKGKWLYVDFWASWCRPCIETFPAAKKLQEDLKNENLEFITIALNDQEKAWKAAMLKHGIAQGENYLIKNSTTSTVLEELQIETIPHYLIYNPEGELVNGYAKRPGEGAKQQLQDYIN